MLALRADRGFRRESGGSAGRHHRLLSVRETAAEIAGNASRGPGSFHDAYLDALYTLQPENFLEEAV